MRCVIRRAALLVWVLGAPLLPGRAVAQDLNPRTFPIGEEALTLGGAYVGRAADASAAYYNPAGLTFGRSGSVGLSLALNVFDRYRVDGVTDLDVTFDFTDTQGVPFFAGASTQFGREDSGDARHAVAAATFAPRNQQRRFVFGGDGVALDVAQLDRTRWYGVAYAYRPVSWLSLGVGAFLGVRRMEHRETELQLAAVPAGRFTETRLDAEKLLFRIGALIRPVPQLSFGLTFQPPAVVVGARARVLATRTEDRTLRTVDRGGSSPLPWELRLGAAWVPVEEVLVTADVALSGPMGSAEDPVFLVEPDADGNPAELLTRFLADRYHTDAVVDVAVGGRVMVADVVPISAGFFTSLSAAPPIPDAAPRYAPDRVHRLGASLSAGYRDETVNFNLGVMGALGFGDALIDDGAGVYVRTGVESQTLVVFVSGAVGAALRVGRQLVEDVVEPALDFMDPREDEGAPDEESGSASESE